MKYGWLVRFQKGTKMRDRDFGFNEEEARAFFFQRRKYFEPALLIKYSPEPWFLQWTRAQIWWGGFAVSIREILAVTVPLAALLWAWRHFR